MPIVYKIDVLSALKEAGYNTNRIRKEKIMGEAMLQKIRSGQMPSWGTLEVICLSARRSDRVCERRGIRRRCPRKGQFHFLNKTGLFRRSIRPFLLVQKCRGKQMVFWTRRGIFREKTISLSSWRIGVDDTPAKWLFYIGGRFLRLSAGRGICARSSAETKKGGF